MLETDSSGSVHTKAKRRQKDRRVFYRLCIMLFCELSGSVIEYALQALILVDPLAVDVDGPELVLVVSDYDILDAGIYDHPLAHGA